jgi:hypothetical protein
MMPSSPLGKRQTPQLEQDKRLCCVCGENGTDLIDEIENHEEVPVKNLWFCSSCKVAIEAERSRVKAYKGRFRRRK